MIIKVAMIKQYGDTFLFKLVGSSDFISLAGLEVDGYDLGDSQYKCEVGTSRKRGRFPKSTIRALLEQQERACLYCYTPFKTDEYHIDHFVPLALGGTNSITNLCLACSKCNRRKGAIYFKTLTLAREYLNRR